MSFLDFFRRKNITKTDTSTTRVLSRKEFAAQLTQMNNGGTINEDAEPSGGTMMMLSASAAFQFRKPFYATIKPTVRELIDDLYQQYLQK